MQQAKLTRTLMTLLAATALLVGVAGAQTTLVPGDDIQAAIDTAADGEIITLTAGTYTLPAQLNVDNDQLTISGVGESDVTLVADGSWGYGIRVTASGITLENFTLHATTTSYPIHASGTSNPPDGLDDLTIQNVTIEPNPDTGDVHQRTGFDIHGYNDVVLSNLTSTGATGGNGVQVTGCVSVDMDNITTSGNAWGSIAVYASNSTSYLGRGSTDVTIDGATLDIAEGPVYSQDISTQNLFNTNITVTGYDYHVYNSNFREPDYPDSEEYTFILETLADAEAFALSFTGDEEYSTIEELPTGNFIVADGMSIQTAIDAASDGDVIDVLAGTYDENVQIDKALTLNGPNAGISPNTGTRGAEAIIDPTTGRGISVDNTNGVVVIDGLTIDDATDAGFFLVERDGFAADVTIRNMIVTDISGYGIKCALQGSPPYADHPNLTIEDNFFQNTLGPGNSAIWLREVSGALTVQDNVIDTTGYGGILLIDGFTGSTLVDGNQISNTPQQGLQLAGVVNGATVSNNTITSANTDDDGDKGGIRIYGENFTDTVNIFGNTISGSHNGIAVKDGMDITGKDINVYDNDLAGNSNFGLYHGGTGLVDASLNWWGANDPAVVATRISGSDVDYSPWYASGTDAEPGTPGFQGELSELWVGPGGSIQEAIDAVVGSTVNVAAGTYTENITIDKHISLIGAGSASDPASNTIITQTQAGAGDNKVGVVQLEASGVSTADPLLLKDLRLEPVSLAGISVGRFTEATGQLVEHVELDNVHVVGTNTDPSTEQERGLYVDLTSTLRHLTVADSAFDDLTYGWYFQKEVSAETSTVENVSVSNTTFNHNNHKGIYAEKLSEATFAACTVDQNGFDSSVLPSYFQAWSAGIDVNLKAGSYQNLQFIDCVVTSNATDEAKEGVGLTVKGRDDGPTYSPFPASVDGVTITGGQYTGNERGIRLGEPGKNNATPTNVVISGAEIRDNVQNYSGSDGSPYGGVINAVDASTDPVDARSNWWGTPTGPYHPILNPAGLGNAVSDNVLFDPWLGLANLSLDPATALIDCDGSQEITVQLAIDDYTAPIFGINVELQAAGNLAWNDPQNENPFGSNTLFEFSDEGNGVYSVSLTTVGNPAQPLDTAGTYDLFTVDFDAVSEGAGDITVETFELRDSANNPIPAGSTAGATITVDCTAPVAVGDIAAEPGHNKIELTWSHDGADTQSYEIYRALWHDGTVGDSAYPEYDDVATAPTHPATYADLLADADWEQVGTVDATEPLEYTDTWPDASSRGVYFYEVFAVDAVDNTSQPAAAYDGATNYWLGDFDADGGVDAVGDVHVLGEAFGESDGDDHYNNIVDVGPTDDNSAYGIPGTDDTIDFEDLMITALNFGVVSPSKGQPTISESVDLAWTRLGQSRWALHLESGQGLQGVRVRAAVPSGAEITVSEGALLGSQSATAFLRNVGDGLDVSLALLGTGASFDGTGELFVVDLSQPVELEEIEITARDHENGAMEVTLAQVTAVEIPTVFDLGQNYPNPFNPQTTIEFALPEAADVQLKVYGVDGRLVKTLVNETRAAGHHEVIWRGVDDTGRRVATGTYFYVIEADDFHQVHKMTLVK